MSICFQDHRKAIPISHNINIPLIQRFKITKHMLFLEFFKSCFWNNKSDLYYASYIIFKLFAKYGLVFATSDNRSFYKFYACQISISIIAKQHHKNQFPNEYYIFDQLFHINLYSVSVAYLYFDFIILLLLIISNIPTNF